MSLKPPYLTEPELESWLTALTYDPATTILTSSTVSTLPTSTPTIPTPAKSLTNLPTLIQAKIITLLDATDPAAAVCLALTSERYRRLVTSTLGRTLDQIVPGPCGCEACKERPSIAIAFLKWALPNGVFWHASRKRKKRSLDYADALVQLLATRHEHFQPQLSRLREALGREKGRKKVVEQGTGMVID